MAGCCRERRVNGRNAPSEIIKSIMAKVSDCADIVYVCDAARMMARRSYPSDVDIVAPANGVAYRMASAPSVNPSAQVS
ncbi:hypothetical protein GCM10022405_40550 [Gibbsiella dentisursi]|uniref:Uncharacterized protein n=1 Tax=Gibbsiella dentisursi TaxID=796890 RepID=A0ABP7LZ21_9GAMM